MKSLLSAMLAAACAASLASTGPAIAAGVGAEKRAPAYPMDCAKWKDKARCESLNRDIEACRSKTDDEWRACMHNLGPVAKFAPPQPRDCSKARNKETCETHSSALEVCKDKTTRTEHRQCMAEQLPKSGKTS